MTKIKETGGYNERLFEGSGLRTYFHFARFRWLASRVSVLGLAPESVLELGCYDAKLIDFLPERPRRYVGVDANWENGLDLARDRWRDHPAYSFHYCRSPDEMAFALIRGEQFDISVAMETLEHVPPFMVRGYLDHLLEHTSKYLFVTVPNEGGVVFVSKWIARRLLRQSGERYSFAEILNSTLGRLDRVARNEHKGFDYRLVVDEIARRFELVEVSGHPFGFLPTNLCFGIGIIGKKR